MAEAIAPQLARAVRLARWLLLVCVIGVLLVLFWPSRPAGADQDGLEHWLQVMHAHGQLLWLTFGRVEFSANIAMFVPLGALAALSRPRGGNWTAWAGCAALSVVAELVQWLLLSNRTADIRDVVANSLGAAIGVALVALYSSAGWKPGPQPRRK